MQKKKSYVGGAVGFIFLSIVCLLLSFVMFVGGDMDYLMGENPDDINEIVKSAYPQKNDYVKLDTYLTVGQFAVTKHKINGIIPAGTEKHYMVMLEDGSMIAVTVKNKKDIKKLDKQVDQTWEYIEGSRELLPSMLDIEGQLSTMDSKIEEYFKDYLDDIGYDNSMGDIHYLSIDMTQNRVKAWSIIILLFLGGMAFITAAVFTIKKGRREKRESKEPEFWNDYR